MKIYLATGNPHKVEELQSLLGQGLPKIKVYGAEEFGGMPNVSEDAGTFEGNALIKARALGENAPAGSWILADDSGLVVDALGGAPGIYSSRYAGTSATANDNRAKLLAEMEGVSETKRHARFVCVLTLLDPKGLEHSFNGTCDGCITQDEQGKGGFGYDPVFRPEGHSETFGNLPAATKNSISHRANALQALVSFLKDEMPVR